VGDVIAELMAYRTAGNLFVEASTARALVQRSLDGAAATPVLRQARSPEPVSSLTADGRVQALLARMRALEATPSAKIGDADELIGDVDREYTALRQALDFPLMDLRAREKLRKRGFVSSGGEANAALLVRDDPAAPPRSDAAAARRAGYFRASARRDPGPLSKFGEGDGSFFDAWLGNHRFAHAAGGAVSSGGGDGPSAAAAPAPALFDYVGTDPFSRPTARLPRVGLKQWGMPHAELVQAHAFASQPPAPAPRPYGAVATGYETRRVAGRTPPGGGSSSGGSD
jgi:hypothetical protein